MVPVYEKILLDCGVCQDMINMIFDYVEQDIPVMNSYRENDPPHVIQYTLVFKKIRELTNERELSICSLCLSWIHSGICEKHV